MSFLPLLSAHADSTAAHITPAAVVNRPSSAATTPEPSIAVSTAPSPAVQPAQSSAVAYIPQCTPDTSYQLPNAITPTASGLDVVVDTPSTYTIYGDSTSQIMNQMADCTPVTSSGTGGTPGKYGASTANAVSWSVSYSQNGSVCSVASVGVTIHINQVFPSWTAPSNASSSLIADWQTYIAKLHTYEQGHVNLDEIYAKYVYNDISAVQPSDCASIDQTVNTIARNDLSQSLSANSNYDKVNDFGNKEDVNL